MSAEREGRRSAVPRLFERVLGRPHAAPSEPSADAPREQIAEDDRMRALETRLDHLESELEGLQDSVHREGARREEKLRALEQRTEPATLMRILSRYWRERRL
jgi:hypothetical protein